MIKLLLLIVLAGCTLLPLMRKHDQSFYETELNIAFEKKADIQRYKYCPDNTCSIYETPLNTEKDTLNDFVLIHLIFVPGYIYLKNFKEKYKKLGKRVLAKRSTSCSGEDEERAKCVLRQLASVHNIKILDVRFDEGVKCTTQFNLDDLLEQNFPPNVEPEIECKRAK